MLRPRYWQVRRYKGYITSSFHCNINIRPEGFHKKLSEECSRLYIFILAGAIANAFVLPSNVAQSITGKISAEFPIPGTPGGGILPSVATQTAQGITALRLVPNGLTPIAVFPSYRLLSKLPAISVIWSENTDSLEGRTAVLKQKNGMYGLWTKQWRQTNCLKRQFRGTSPNTTHQGSISKAKSIKNKMRKLKKDVYCHRRRLQQRMTSRNGKESSILSRALLPFTNILKGISNLFTTRKRRQLPPSCVDTEEPKFGFRTLITLADKEPCILGVTCTIDGKKLEKTVSSGDLSYENNNNNTVKKESDFVPSEMFEWTDSGFRYLKRRRRQTDEDITASQLQCKLIDGPTEESCLNKP